MEVAKISSITFLARKLDPFSYNLVVSSREGVE